MSLLARLNSLVGSAKTIQAGLRKAQAVATSVKMTVEGIETASFQESFRKAAQGDAAAQYEIAEDYYFGDSVSQDYSEALKWFLKAAEQGHPRAQSNVGMLYALGRGAERDCVEAFKWISLAAAKGDKSALKTQNALLRKMTPEQQAEARRRAEEFVGQRLPRRTGT